MSTVDAKAPRGPARDGGQTRQRILAEALRLFTAKGFAQTTTRDIAHAAGIGDASMYRHFPSKEALVRELFLDGYTAYGAWLREAAGQGGPVGDRIDRIVRGLCALFDADPVRFRFLLINQHDHLAHLPEGAPNPVDILRGVIADGIRAAEIPDRNVELMTAAVMGVVLQPAVAKIYGRLDAPFGAMAEEIVAACLRVLRA